MSRSKQIGGLVGPTLVAAIIAESQFVQPRLYDLQIPPVVYLSGVLMFLGGLAVVRAHNLWARDWTLLVTLSGWALLLLGLFRMFASSAYLEGYANTNPAVFLGVEGVLLLVGLVITFGSYRRGEDTTDTVGT